VTTISCSFLPYYQVCSQDFTLGGGGTEAELWAPRRRVGIGEGCPFPQPTRGSGERRELPQRGPRRSPGRQRSTEHFW